MRILVAAHNYPRFEGDPAGAYVRRLGLGLQGRGHSVSIVAPHVPGTAERVSEAGLQVHRFRYAPESFERIGYRGEARVGRILLAPAALALPSYLLSFRRALRRQIATFRPDIIHAHWWLPAGWLAAQSRIPLVVTSHGSDVRLLERSGLFVWMAKGVARRAASWTTVSRFLARELETTLGLPSVDVTPMPIDATLFERGRTEPKVTPPRILYAGNLLLSKGVDLLIEAVALLRDRGVECQLRILGEGPAKAELEALIEARGVRDRVGIVPFVAQDKMPAEYGAASITVLPTKGKAEGLGLSLVEALLAGSAVVGTAAGGIPEVVEDRVTGLLAPASDPAALAERLGELLRDSSLREQLTSQGYDRVRRTYSLDASVDRFLSVFDAAVHHPARN